MNLNYLQTFLGNLMESLNDIDIERLTDMCNFSIEKKTAGFFIPAYSNINIVCKFESHPQIDSDKVHESMIVTIHHNDDIKAFEYSYESSMFTVVPVVASNYSTSDPAIVCKPS